VHVRVLVVNGDDAPVERVRVDVAGEQQRQHRHGDHVGCHGEHDHRPHAHGAAPGLTKQHEEAGDCEPHREHPGGDQPGAGEPIETDRGGEIGERTAGFRTGGQDRLERGIWRRRERRAREEPTDRERDGKPCARSTTVRVRRGSNLERKVAGRPSAGRDHAGTLHVADRIIGRTAAGVFVTRPPIRAASTRRYCDTHRVSSSNDGTGSGPWPEPGEPHTLDPQSLGVEAPGEPATGGSRAVALAVAGVNLVVMLALPVLIVVGVYTFLTVYAVVKAVSGGSDSADAATVLIGVVALVTLFTTLLGVGGWAIGRTADPKKRRSR